MQRQKVNGNGVRAAGNPDEEPNFADYPSCPPSSSQQHQHHDLNQSLIERRADVESLSSTIDQHACDKDSVHILNESVSSCDDDRAVRSGSGTNSLNSSVACEEHNVDTDVGLGETLLFLSPSSLSVLASNQEGMVDSSRQDKFPLKLQRILDKLEQDGRTDIISWLPLGRAFMAHHVDRLVQEILPLHFNQTKYTSFQRQLHMYHIARVVQGPDKGAYFHNQLLRGQPELSKRIRRMRPIPDNGVSKIRIE